MKIFAWCRLLDSVKLWQINLQLTGMYSQFWRLLFNLRDINKVMLCQQINCIIL